MRHLPFFLFLFFLTGCGLFAPPSPPAESYAIGASWIGGDISELKSFMGDPVYQQTLNDGNRHYRWFNEKTVTGPPRRDFRPGGKIKTRPGTIEHYYCRVLVATDSGGRINDMELQGDWPLYLLPPARR